MFGRERRATAEQVAADLAARILDPETCREAATQLSDRPAPDPVGSCEMAFAGAAILKHVIADTQTEAVAARMTRVVDDAVAETFGGVHTPQTQAHYGSESLREGAANAVQRYLEDAFFARRMAETMGARLAISGRPSTELAKVFSDIVRDTVLTISRTKMV